MGKHKTTNASCIRCVTRDKDGSQFKYSLYMKESHRVASYKLPLYSIRIEMNSNEGDYTEAESGEIFSDLGKASVFFDRLVENLATPLNLVYILEDSMYI